MNERGRQLVHTGRFDDVPLHQRAAYYCGGLLVLSGLFHGLVYVVDGGPWEGPVSWRKPVVFGLSFGITLVTLAWMLGFLRPRKAAAWVVLGVLIVASIGEVALVSMQKWRGVPSHFNEDTAFDGMVFSVMGMLVALIVLMTVVMAVWSFFRVDASASLALAIRSGLVLLLVSQMVGVQMIVEGGNTFGANGALKMPHALTLHAIQVLPALALLLSLSEAGERHRVRVVALGTVGYAVLIASSMVQTYGGHGPMDLSLVVVLLAVGGVAVLVASGLIAVREAMSALHQPAEPTHAG